MSKDHIDKRSESQFDKAMDSIPEGVDWSWTAESQDEMARHYEKENKKKEK